MIFLVANDWGLENTKVDCRIKEKNTINLVQLISM